MYCALFQRWVESLNLFVANVPAILLQLFQFLANLLKTVASDTVFSFVKLTSNKSHMAEITYWEYPSASGGRAGHLYPFFPPPYIGVTVSQTKV